ncbi:MAG: hypothetical protein AVDCRST_MAG25-314, partial [uncultured Rubrobacteraceae bacterium]
VRDPQPASRRPGHRPRPGELHRRRRGVVVGAPPRRRHRRLPGVRPRRHDPGGRREDRAVRGRNTGDHPARARPGGPRTRGTDVRATGYYRDTRRLPGARRALPHALRSRRQPPRARRGGGQSRRRL